ncbi:Ubiquitin-conjugating enzyme e2z [Neofusicoccum parvum]|uniref:Ubiquitin-conjugating enzyme E2 Z n=1 Tax=Botryosphaeria parva (strain UCR-NP2) TaxID=1287680 RepID=R1ERQ9_BOTPV|nr:putative ubiquitin-conjugating enzyme e2z protein [Neofusicoccum parvum UCRNP2]GME54886.1 Ubiquitin-conjugating enzyme e2z [Neofusicoccum parvum]
MSNQSILRITRELCDIQKGSDLSLAVACRDSDVRSVRALIIGPPDTPYEFGFFEFAVRFGKEYPTKAPSVNCITTNSGRTRFNPNIYAQGKVCLSILGTWRGEPGEEWSSAQGLESILISIQSLMSPDPYENEPGFEDANSDYDKKLKLAYTAKIHHETIRVSVIERLEEYYKIAAPDKKTIVRYNAEDDLSSSEEPFEPFRDLCKRRFLWYYGSYVESINRMKEQYKEGTKFEKMPFEGPSNEMSGQFNYEQLLKRLAVVREAVDKETLGWAQEGLQATKNELSIANNLQRQFEQVVEHFKRGDNVHIDLELVEKNPFIWSFVFFGSPMSNLDGGMFRVFIYISTKFPDVQPRVKIQTPLFHQRISKDGVLCYTSRRSDDIRSHIEAIVDAIQDEHPAYDPRTLVNPEASKLFWGSPEEKKLYNRKLRRSVQDSAE